ncbi:carboxypeptidase regulatory-like domain-containing protein [Ectothiorhodospiraceae bacterium 2226]|nr:carboxypeptidase regulatory-like domain-containing protein [Ectothiorhodospiraceae bacterium 2226]
MIALLWLGAPLVAGAETTEIFTVSGPWTVPEGVTEVTVEVWGGGGGGGTNGNHGGGGGGGGAYAAATVPVVAGDIYSIIVGAGGGAGAAAGTSQFGPDGGAAPVIAPGGQGGADNSTAAGVGGSGAFGAVTANGCSGGTGQQGGGNMRAGGGGGGSPLNCSVGGDGSANVPGSGGSGEGAGGAGGASGANGADGAAPGGGGGGSGDGGSGGSGARGEVRLSYVITTYTISGTVTNANGEPLANVLVTAEGGHTQEVSTDAGGVFLFDGVTHGSSSIAVTPALQGYTFDPDSHLVPGPVDADVVNVDFTGMPALDHVRLEHPGSGLTCQTTPVVVRLCANADCTKLHTDPTEVSLSPPQAWPDATVTVSAGSALLALRHPTPGVLTLGASAAGAASASQCVSGSGCQFTVHEAGFALELPNIAACSVGEGIIRAVRADPSNPERCIGDGGFASRTASLGFWYTYSDPADGLRGVHVHTESPPIELGGVSPGTPVELEFDEAAEATFSFSYADAGRIALHTRFADDELLMEGAGTFVAVPELVIEAHASGGGGAMTAAGLPSPPDRRHAAGYPFDMHVRAQCADGSISPGLHTPSFALDDIQIEHVLAEPAGGEPGSLAVTAFAVEGGQATVVDQAVSEVGRHILRVVPPDYLDVPMNSVDLVPAARFTPGYFDVLVMDHGCSNSPGMTYSGQALGEVVVNAQRHGGGLTRNYDGALGYAQEVRLVDAANDAETGLSGHVLAASIFANGTASVIRDTGTGAGVTYTFDDVETLPYDLTLRAVDADGISSATGLEDKTEVRSARLRVANAHGTDQLGLPVPLRIESWRDLGGGLATWLIEQDDQCTDIVLGAVKDEAYQEDLSSITIDGIALVNGEGAIELAAPHAYGSVDLVVDLDNAGAPWLKFDWVGSGSAENPKGRASFGIFGGNPKRLYMQERY